MADKAGGVLSNLLKKLPFKSPWKVTGVASTPEFQTYLTRPGEYRKHAPANPPVAPIIPHARPDRVYDIKYWPRDERRGGMVVGGTNRRFVDTVAVDVSMAAPDAPAEAGPPAALGAPYKWAQKGIPLLENSNNGYT